MFSVRRISAGLIIVGLGLWAGLSTVDSPAVAQEEAPAIPLELTKVPPDAAVFAHVRFAPVWEHPTVTEVRKAIEQAIPKQDGKMVSVEDLAKTQLGVDPANVETVTFFMPQVSGPGDEELLAIIVTMSQPYDRSAIFKPLKRGDKPLGEDLVALPGNMVLHYTTARTFAVMEKSLVEDYQKAAPVLKEGAQRSAIELAASGKFTAVGGLNLDKLPRDLLLATPPPPIRPYIPLFKSDTIVGRLNLEGKKIQGSVMFHSSDKLNAGNAKQSLELLVRLIEQTLEEGKREVKENAPSEELAKEAEVLLDVGLKAVKTAKVTQEGNSAIVTASLELDGEIAKSVTRIAELAQKEQARVTSQNNLKQIALAMHNYHDTYRGFPPAAIVDKRGKPLLSWRVAILPFIEQDNLYKQFKMDEPWDSEHNKKLIKQMPKVYFNPNVNKPGDTTTHYRVFAGNGAVFDPVLPSKIAQIRDGTSNTIMVVESEEAVPWTKPTALEYDPKQLPKLLYVNDRAFAAFCDGSVRTLPKDIAEKTLRLLIMANDGMPVPDF